MIVLMTPSAPGLDTMTLTAGDLLFEAGTPATTVYFVETGEVELLAVHGTHETRLTTARPGDPIGELEAIAGARYAYAVRALTDATLVAVGRDVLLEVLSAHPEVGVAILRRLASRTPAFSTAAELSAPVTAEASGRVPPESPAPAATAPAARPRFVHVESGIELLLPDKAEIAVGRGNRRQPVDLDLTPVDTTRSVSRRHAWLARDGDAVDVREEPGARNGTFVNGVRLTAEERRRLKPGDEVQFGHAALVYRADPR